MHRLTRMLHSRWTIPALLALLILVAAPVIAQQGGGYDQTWHTVESGQVVGDLTTGYGLRGVVGQPDAHPVTPDNISGGGYTLTSGFLSPSTNPQNPTVLVLVRFTVQPSDAGARLSWTTATERDVSGFFVQRQAGGEWARSSDLIPATGDNVSGATYEYTDADGTAESAYRLEAVSSDGTSTFYVPIDLPDAQSDVQLYLPRVTR